MLQRDESLPDLGKSLHQQDFLAANPPSPGSRGRRDQYYLWVLLAALILGLVSVFTRGVHAAILGLAAVLFTVGTFSLLLAAKSVADFTRTGPQLKDEVLKFYRMYAIFAFLRLLSYAFLVLCILAGPGIISYFALTQITGFNPSFWVSVASISLSILLLGALQFSRHLLWLPANIIASYNYRLSRLYPYWRTLSPHRLRAATWALLGFPAVLTAAAVAMLLVKGEFMAATAFGCGLLFYATLGLWLRSSEPLPTSVNRPARRPNILMIGSDTLRSDRLDGTYGREAAPFLKSLAEQGTLFTQCYVPCARTAPSLLSLLTGSWPHRLGVRDNFVPDERTRLPVEALPSLLKKHGYFTAALSDWCGADMGKFDLGFDYADVPKDQWNIKLFIRQGPKDLRLLLSLFSRNHLGKRFLPEIYYLGGVPQTDELGLEARGLISRLALQEQPFFLNVFFSTTHGPFGAEYPYYAHFADPNYQGESKFVMARVTDPWEIIRRQAEPREAFDLDQVINLYDGCVARFDDEVKRIMDHLSRCGLMDNTIVVVYSDHGMEFFENQTWGQGNSVISDVSNRIPLLIRAPGMKQGGNVTSPVRSIDLAPTLLDLVGVEYNYEMDGVSLKCLLQDSASKCDLDVFCETGIWLTNLPGTPSGHLCYPGLLDLLTVRDIATGTISLKPEYEDIIIGAKDRMIRSGRWKLVYQPLENGPLLRLFDLEQDQQCLTDVSAENQQIVSCLWLRLRSWIFHEAKTSVDNPKTPVGNG